MDLRFTTPELAALDKLGTEVIVCGLLRDERPPHGVAGLLDWRLAGRLSRLALRGFATGRLGEVLMLPGKPKLPFDKVLVFGLGEREAFDEDAFRSVLEHILSALSNLRVRTAVVELPGRHFGAIPAQRSADVLLELVDSSQDHDVWTLVEPPEAQKSITQHMIQERRRIRRA